MKIYYIINKSIKEKEKTLNCQHYNICIKQEPLCNYSKCKVNVDILRVEDEIRLNTIRQMLDDWKLNKEK
jgi:hypothetical protein